MTGNRETSPTPSLCRFEKHTCGACCWGVGIDRQELTVRLRRHRLLFQKLNGRLPNRLQASLHELRARRGADLLWTLLMRIPFISRRLKQQLSRRLVCAFLGFDSEEEKGVGCMIHPSRYDGIDIRNQTAFQLLPGVECGDPDYVCSGCHKFDAMTQDQQQIFSAAVEPNDWYEYTETVRAFSCGVLIPLKIPDRTESAA